MERRAKEGDADAAVLVRGLQRLAAGQLLERFADLCHAIVSNGLLIVAQHASQPDGAERWASVRRALSVRAARRASASSNRDARSIVAALRSSLRTGRHCDLAPGAMTAVDASLVLLKGALINPGYGTDTRADAAEATPQAKAPCVMVWSSFQRGSTIMVKAGARGVPLHLVGALSVLAAQCEHLCALTSQLVWPLSRLAAC